jgi:hypothetical protein
MMRVCAQADVIRGHTNRLSNPSGMSSGGVLRQPSRLYSGIGVSGEMTSAASLHADGEQRRGYSGRLSARDHAGTVGV